MAYNLMRFPQLARIEFNIPRVSIRSLYICVYMSHKIIQNITFITQKIVPQQITNPFKLYSKTNININLVKMGLVREAQFCWSYLVISVVVVLFFFAKT